MNGGVVAFMLAGVICIASGLFMVFDADNSAGTVFIAVGATFLALGAAKAGKNRKENGDAG